MITPCVQLLFNNAASPQPQKNAASSLILPNTRGFLWIFSSCTCSKFGPKTGGCSGTSKDNCLDLIELSSINTVSLVYFILQFRFVMIVCDRTPTNRLQKCLQYGTVLNLNFQNLSLFSFFSWSKNID